MALDGPQIHEICGRNILKVTPINFCLTGECQQDLQSTPWDLSHMQSFHHALRMRLCGVVALLCSVFFVDYPNSKPQVVSTA